MLRCVALIFLLGLTDGYLLGTSRPAPALFPPGHLSAPPHFRPQRPSQYNNILSLNLNVGPFKASINLGSDLVVMKPSMSTVQNLEQLRAKLNVDEATKYQLQMVTKMFLDIFGLYEPFRKKTKALVLNNPVYYGHQSGMVNYSKNLHKNGQPEEEVKEAKPTSWEGLNGQMPESVENQHDLTRVVNDQRPSGITGHVRKN